MAIIEIKLIPKAVLNAFFISIQNDSVGDIYDRATYDSQIAWLSENLNNYVTTLRPMAREYSEVQ